MHSYWGQDVRYGPVSVGAQQVASLWLAMEIGPAVGTFEIDILVTVVDVTTNIPEQIKITLTLLVVGAAIPNGGDSDISWMDREDNSRKNHYIYTSTHQRLYL